jgi:fructose-1,6-bisphosphatase
MKPFKFFVENELVKVEHIFQYEIENVHHQFNITKYTLLSLESNIIKLVVDLEMNHQEFLQMIDYIKYKKINGTIFGLSNGEINSKVTFVGILYSSERVLNNNECQLEFYLDYFRFF